MGLLKFNLNYEIRVRIKDNGIEHCVKKHNETMPFRLQKSFQEFKNQADSDGYHRMQMHSLMDWFGDMGLRISDLIDINILLNKDDVKDVE